MSPSANALLASNSPTNNMLPLELASAIITWVNVCVPLSVLAGKSIAFVFFAVCVSVESEPIVVQLAAGTCCLAYPPKVASVTEPVSAADTAVANPTYILSPGLEKLRELFLNKKCNNLLSK